MVNENSVPGFLLLQFPDDEPHGPFDRDLDDAVILVHPGVTVDAFGLGGIHLLADVVPF